MSFIIENNKPTFKFNQPLSTDITQIILNYFLGIDRPNTSDIDNIALGYTIGWLGNLALYSSDNAEVGSNLQNLIKNTNITEARIQQILEEVEMILQNMVASNVILSYSDVNVYENNQDIYIDFSIQQSISSPFAKYVINATQGILS